MDDVPSETCFVFFKKYKKNELQKHRVAHQGDILLLLRSLNNDNNDNNSNSYDNLWGLAQEHHCSSTALSSRVQ